MMLQNGQRVAGNKGHVYFFDGFRYPSVTTILHRVVPEAPELLRWKQTFRSKDFKNSREYANYTAMRGTFIHYSVLNSLTPFMLDPGDLPETSLWIDWREKMVQEIRAAVKLWEGLDIKIKSPQIETPLCHHGLWYAGQPDLIATVTYGGKTLRTLIDLKTSKQPYESHYIQLGAYSQLVEHMIKTKIERGLLIYLNPNASKADVVVIEPGELKENCNIFNEYRNQFYNIENVDLEYGLVLSH